MSESRTEPEQAVPAVEAVQRLGPGPRPTRPPAAPPPSASPGCQAAPNTGRATAPA